MLKPTRKAETEYWYRQNGTPLGLPASYTPPGWDPDKPYRPEEGAFITTPAIAAACAPTPNPSICAMMKELEQDCLTPVDTETRTQCKDILEGRVPDLPPPSDPIPPLADWLGPARPGAPQMNDAAVAADPGFQRMCDAARANFNACAVNRQKMTSMGSGGLGSTGQAGAFYECQQLYAGVLNMCGAVNTQRLPYAAAATPNQPAPTVPPVQKAACPPGTTLNKDGYCLRADQQYCGGGMACSDGMACEKGGRCFYASKCWPGETATGTGKCIPAGSVLCPGGKSYCDPGEYCLPGGGCGGGAPATGPMCSSGRRALAGYVCNPYAGYSYNPRRFKLCGTTICDIRSECGQNACPLTLPPNRSSAAGWSVDGGSALLVKAAPI